jgi:predicted nucleotide-binding protein
MLTNLIMPQMGERITEGTITKWRKKTGEQVERDEALFEISTEKVDAEIPAPISGILQEIKVGVGETVPVKTIVGIMAAYGETEVFVVHGRNEAVKESVARFLEKLHLHPIILHEQPNKGRTIIEKFEGHSDVGFAVVLLTPDDVGELASSTGEHPPRARQNVILELGYFLGKLGRARVCVLHMHGLEIPSDILGVLYVPYDADNGWRLKLAKELKAAGMPVDLNRV